METEARLQSIVHISQKPLLSGSPVMDPSLKVPFMEPLADRCPTTTALLHSSVKVPGIRPPPTCQDGRGLHGERCPYPETILTYLPGSPVKELHPRPALRSLFRERCSIPRAPFIQLSKSPVDDPTPVSQTEPPWTEMPSPEPSFHNFQYPPAKEPLLQVPLTELLYREIPEPTFNYRSEFPVNGPPPHDT